MAYRVNAKFEDQTIRKNLREGRNLVGSDSSCEICLKDPTVSRQHAALTVRGSEVILEDLGSTNGTLLRSRRIEGAERVHPEDVFVIGRVVGFLEEIADEDLEIGIGLPRVGVDPSGKIRVDLEDLRETTDSFTPLDRFTLEHLPRLLEQLLRGGDRQEIAQRIGASLFDISLVLKVEISELVEETRGVLFRAEKEAEESALPEWSDAKVGAAQVRACFKTRRAARHYQALVDAAALLLALTEKGAADMPPEIVPSSSERPQPPTVDPAVRLIYDQADRVARGDVGVMIYGESGTGKEVLANFIHAASPRAEKKMVAINCASLPRDLLEAELFGVEKGVATGVEARPGKFEAAHGSTLFLDEIGDMAPETQAKILRVLQEKQVYRLGGHTPCPAEARIVAATNRPIHRLIAEGEFRNDLYHRIATWEVELPPLRHRRADIPNLAAHFLSLESKRHGIRAKGISRAALKALQGYNWPGNIRQLRNEISRATLFLDNGELLDTSRLSAVICGASENRSSSLQEILENVERDEIKMALEAAQGDTALAAERLQMSRPTLYRRIKSLGIQAPE